MFFNLKKEMARKKITYQIMAKILGVSTRSVYSKINGKTEFKYKELDKIKKQLFPNLSLDYLFAIEEEEEQTV